jgi:CheY-like chemotaxis protein
MARKQVLRALPADWPVSVTEAGNGHEAMDAIRLGLGQVVLLDLTMPEMDGYQVLSALRAEGLAAGHRGSPLTFRKKRCAACLHWARWHS